MNALSTALEIEASEFAGADLTQIRLVVRYGGETLLLDGARVVMRDLPWSLVQDTEKGLERLQARCRTAIIAGLHAARSPLDALNEFSVMFGRDEFSRAE